MAGCRSFCSLDKSQLQNLLLGLTSVLWRVWSVNGRAGPSSCCSLLGHSTAMPHRMHFPRKYSNGSRANVQCSVNCSGTGTLLMQESFGRGYRAICI
ncbi:hypothetical protein EVAR_61379_1 [Eumeta japonica]|uniref:Uncharacterized protein n=1 Tax=Eumeta variegata TaxID=151549 RepID=A0A4C1Z6G4_EUMVA|nr:hypothetical protein EVAR_61379_1 [Eumeta japonica]